MRLRQKTAEGQSEAQAYRRLPFTSPVQGYLDNPGCGLGSIADSGTITNYFARASRTRPRWQLGRASVRKSRPATGLAVMQAPATPGKKAHFCDGHHIADATAALVSHAPGPAGWYPLSPTSAPPTRGFFAFCVSDREHSGGGWG